jgi:tetrahydromethanopterin S-methyltransferase subunit G
MTKTEDKKIEEKIENCCKKDMCKNIGKRGGPGAGTLYGLGFIGAVIYFIQHAQSFWDGVVGILKAIVWPALVSYKLLELFKF